MGYDGQGILIPIVAQQRPKHEGPGFSGQGSNTSVAQTTFIKTRGIGKESIPMEEKDVGKGVHNKPVKYVHRGLEEGSKETIFPSIYDPTLRGPRNQACKHHYKSKRCGIVCLCCKKRGHKASNCWHSRRTSNPYGNY
jgi:hypothetical protein